MLQGSFIDAGTALLKYYVLLLCIVIKPKTVGIDNCPYHDTSSMEGITESRIGNAPSLVVLNRNILVCFVHCNSFNCVLDELVNV